MKKYEGHAPGPWAIGLDTDNERAQVISSDGQHLCYIEQYPLIPNAALIADAPLLLDQRDRLAEVVGRARDGFASLATILEDPNFTDRYGDGARCRRYERTCSAALASLEKEKE